MTVRTNSYCRHYGGLRTPLARPSPSWVKRMKERGRMVISCAGSLAYKRCNTHVRSKAAFASDCTCQIVRRAGCICEADYPILRAWMSRPFGKHAYFVRPSDVKHTCHLHVIRLVGQARGARRPECSIIARPSEKAPNRRAGVQVMDSDNGLNSRKEYTIVSAQPLVEHNSWQRCNQSMMENSRARTRGPLMGTEMQFEGWRSGRCASEFVGFVWFGPSPRICDRPSSTSSTMAAF